MTEQTSPAVPIAPLSRALGQINWLAVAVPFAAVIAAFLFGLMLVLATGVPLATAIQSFVSGAFGSAYSISVSFNRAVVFALVGLGFILANRAGLTNVGGEGQIAVGGIAATALALHGGVAGLPLGLSFVLPMLLATLAGACWGGIAGVLRAKVGTNEVITTLLLSFIGIWLVYWSVQSDRLLRQPMTTSATLPESPEIPFSTQLPLLTDSYAAPVTIGLIIAIVLAVVCWILLSGSALGFRFRAVGLNPMAAARAGIAVQPTIVLAMLLAGAFAGLAGAIMLQGEQYSLKTGFSSGFGFDGLVVGLLARGSVVGVVGAAVLFGFLRSGGISMEMIAGVPSALVLVIQGLIVVTIAGAGFWLDNRRAS